MWTDLSHAPNNFWGARPCAPYTLRPIYRPSFIHSTALPLALAAVRLLAMQIHGCVDVSIGDYLAGLSLFVVSVGGGRWWWASVQLLAYVTLLL